MGLSKAELAKWERRAGMGDVSLDEWDAFVAENQDWDYHVPKEQIPDHVWLSAPRTVTYGLIDLIRHMEAHYTDDQLRRDLDAVLDCADPDDYKEIKRYAKAKLGGKPYKAPGVALNTRTCESCGHQFHPKRSTARFCSSVCRKRHQRRSSVSR